MNLTRYLLQAIHHELETRCEGYTHEIRWAKRELVKVQEGMQMVEPLRSTVDEITELLERKTRENQECNRKIGELRAEADRLVASLTSRAQEIEALQITLALLQNGSRPAPIAQELIKPSDYVIVREALRGYGGEITAPELTVIIFADYPEVTQDTVSKTLSQLYREGLAARPERGVYVWVGEEEEDEHAR